MPVAPAESRLDATFAALADPTRRAILARLARGDTHVGDLAGPFAISGPAVSRHLRVLETAGLIERQVNARWRICRLKPAALQAAHGWLDQYRRYWEESLDRLGWTRAMVRSHWIAVYVRVLHDQIAAGRYDLVKQLQFAADVISRVIRVQDYQHPFSGGYPLAHLCKHLRVGR